MTEPQAPDPTTDTTVMPSPAPASTPGPAGPAWEPAPSIAATRVGDRTDASASSAGRRGSPVRWIVALVGVALVAAAAIVVVSLVGARPTSSTAMGYMPDDTVVYSEVRLDLPGDQREKLASFLKPFPGFNDASQFDVKWNELLDRMVRAATKDEQSWSADIAPWFSGQLAFGSGLPAPSGAQAAPMAQAQKVLVVATIRDKAKAIDWITKTAESVAFNRSTYGDAEVFEKTEGGASFAIAVTDQVMLGGTSAAVQAAIDTKGSSGFAGGDGVKEALATVQKDYVGISLLDVRSYADWAVRQFALTQPGILDQTRIDETILEMLPAWQASTVRFENDQLVSGTVQPSAAIGYDAANRADEIAAHAPAKTLALYSVHDLGKSLSAVVGRFRALPETADFFGQIDRALSLVGGFDAAFGWWGDSAIVVSALDDGTIGGGLVVKPRDAAAADRLLTSLSGFIAIGGGSQGVTTRTVDHNGTKVTIADFSQSAATSLPPGYKAEIAWATNADITVVGYGEAFVDAVLDANGATSLAGDARFQNLVGRVGSENIGLVFVDIGAIRKLAEPLAQSGLPAEKWAEYAKELQPYLTPIDAFVSAIRKDGSLDKVTTVLTTTR
jgi:hypothetical protein